MDLTFLEELYKEKDNGSGFDPNEKNNLFVPFYTTRKSGTGIGLSLSRQILLAHQGSINIERENEYTIINIKLPA